MDTPWFHRNGNHGIAAWTALLVGLALVGSLALVPAASSATVTSAWQAKIGAKGANGTAKLQVLNTGTGSVTLRLVKMRPATLLPVVLHKGTCSAVGPVLARLDAIRSSSAGVANRTSSLTVTRVRAILAATRSGKVAIRVGSSAAGGVKCGVFAVLAVPAPAPSATQPTASPSSSPSPSAGGTLFVGPYFMLAIPAGWVVEPSGDPSVYKFVGPGQQIMGVRVVQTGMSLEEFSASTISSLASKGWGSPERVEDIAVGGDPGRMLTYYRTLNRGVHWLEALCVHNGRAYEIVFVNAPGAESADRALFLSVVASFAFLSTPG